MKAILFSALSLSVAACATAQAPVSPAFMIYPDEGELRMLAPEADLDDAGREKLAEFIENRFGGSNYFAALAFSPAGPSHYTGDWNTLEAAKKHALQGCERGLRMAQDHGLIPEDAEGCIIVSVIVPQGYEATDAVTLGHSAANGYRRYLERSPPKAFAVGDRDSWAAHYNGQSLEWARDRAMRNCLGIGVKPESALPTGETCVLIAEQDIED